MQYRVIFGDTFFVVLTSSFLYKYLHTRLLQQYKDYDVAAIFLGTNNIGQLEVEETIYQSYRQLLHLINQSLPRATLIVMDILPRLCKWTRDVPLWDTTPNKCVATFNEVLLSACIDWGVRCSLSHDAFMDSKDNPRGKLFLADGLHPSYSGIKVMLDGLVGFQSFAQYGKLNLIPPAGADLIT